MATANVRVKITNLPVNISQLDVAKELNIERHQVGIPRNQPDPGKWYIWITGFESEQQANEFVTRWNDTIHFGRKITCRVNSTTINQESTVPKSSDNRSRFENPNSHRPRGNFKLTSMGSPLTTTGAQPVSFDSPPDGHSATCTDFNSPFQTSRRASTKDFSSETVSRPVRGSSCSSQSSTQSERPSCRYGIDCHRDNCRFDHPPERHVCEDGVQCDDYNCTANHPPGRKNKCLFGNACRNITECDRLHPDTLQTDCPSGEQCQIYSCTASHPPNRPKPCFFGKRCHNTSCSRLHPVDRLLCIRGVECSELDCTGIHPPGRSVKCAYGLQCENANCSRLHPPEWDPPESSVTEQSPVQTRSSRNQRNDLKSLEKRMAERQAAHLPVLGYQMEFCQRLEREKLLVVKAETGSGKSTQLPQYAAEYFSSGLVICTQPRVVAAMSLARRVADEFDGTSEGNSVGYQVGSSSGKNNRVQGSKIMFMTDAALIHQSQSDPELSGVRVLLIDEAHERSLNTDIVIGIAKLLLKKRPNDFFVVIASATIDTSLFLKFFERTSNGPLSIRGVTFPVKEDYLPPPEDCTDQKLIETHVVPTVLRLYPQHQGHTLVFLHGQREIEQALKLFNRDIPDDCVALPLYGSLSSEDQDKVLKFDDEDSKRRMVVFCTNVAETSLTIKNTRLVIDSGLAKEARFDVRRRLTVIETVRISVSSANQRKGRAGRTVAGHCFRLYNKSDLKRENIEPEILRSSLDLIVLQLVRLGLDPRTFPFIDAPAMNILDSSLALLISLSCISNGMTSTIRGQLFAELALDPRRSAFMVDMYTDVGGEHLLALTSKIVAILSAPGSLFYMGGVDKKAKDEARGRVAVGAYEHDSDLFYLCAVYNNWKNAGTIDRTINKCTTCQKPVLKRFDACRSCRTQYSNTNGLNNKILQIIDSSSDLYMRTIMNSRWKLTPSTNTVVESDERDIIGEHLYRLFPEQLGHLLVAHLPDEGVRLIGSDLRARITETSVFVQRLHDHGHQHFVSMSITQLPAGDYIVNHLHPVPSRRLPPISIEKLFCWENVGWMVNNEVRKKFDERRIEPGAKWVVYEYDRRASRVIIWGLRSDKIPVQTTLTIILTDVRSRLDAKTHSIGCGPIQASFKSGLICSTIEAMDNTLRIDLQHVPCANFNQLQTWLQTKLGVSRQDIKENSFRGRSGTTEHDEDDDDYEAPPFHITFKSAEIFKEATKRLLQHYIYPQGMPSSTSGTRMNEKDAWGRQLIITTARGTGSKTAEQILQSLTPHVIDCRERGKTKRTSQPAFQLSNLPAEANEPYIRQVLQPVNPAKVNIRQTNTDGTGSVSAHIFFNDDQQRQQAYNILQSSLCQFPISINIRSKKTQQLVRKTVIPTISDIPQKESPAQNFLITAVNRHTAHKLYTEIIPRLEPSWSVDSTALVTVSQTDAYPNFTALVQQIAAKFGTEVQQQPYEQKHHKNGTNNDIRCIFSHAPPPKTALAAAMLAQITSPTSIKLTNDRQKRLFQELFDQNLIQTWCHQRNLKIEKKDKWGTTIEIRGLQIQQGQLMRLIADYSDQFDQRFREHELNTSTGNLFGRQKTANVKLEKIHQKWSTKGCTVSYVKRNNSIVVYAQPSTNQADIQACERELRYLLSDLAGSDDASRDERQCVFCGKMSGTTKILRLCGHSYCRCAPGFLSERYPFQCHEPTCKVYIDVQDLQEIFSGRDELMRLCKKSLQIYLEKNTNADDRRFCPNDECDGLIKGSLGYQTCLTCGRGVCPSCRIIDDDTHQGRTCAEREKFQREMGEFLPQLFQAAENYARNYWTPDLPPIIRIDHNLPLAEKCSSLERFYRAAQALGARPPPDLARGFFAFHGTASDAIKPICTQGFDPTRRRGQAYGPGEYFGVTAAVSDGYSHSSQSGEVKHMLVAFILRCNLMHTVPGFCHVVNNPTDWSHAYNLPVLVISYGRQKSAPAIFGTSCQSLVQEKNDHWHTPFRWHWLEDDQQFKPYTDATNEILERYYEQYRFQHGPSTVITEPLTRYIDDKPQTYEIDYINFIQRHTSTRNPRKIARTPVPLTQTRDWFYENEHNQWIRYQALVQDRVEQAYQSYVRTVGPSRVNIQFPGRPEMYEVNFSNGTQTNKTSNAIRKIRRQ